MSQRPRQILITLLGLLAFGAAPVTQAAAQSGQVITQPTIVGMTFSQAQVTEGDGAATSSVTLTLAFDPPAGADRYDAEHLLTINYATRNGAAAGRDAATAGTCNAPGADYAPASGSFTFSGQASATISLQVCSDGLSEGDEQFAVRFEAIEPNRATAINIRPLNADRDGFVTISDDEPRPTLSITPAVQIDEPDSGQTAAVFTVSLAGPQTQRPVTVNFAAAPGTAVAGSRCPIGRESADYVTRNGTLTFNPVAIASVIAPRTQQIHVQVCADNRFQEPNETFFVSLTGAVNAVLPVQHGASRVPSIAAQDIPVATGTATIVD